MKSILATLCFACLGLSLTQAFTEDYIESFGGENGMGYFAYRNLNNRLQALETNVRTGAYGGCESGVVGPFTPTQRTGTITFRGRFLAPPSVSLALSDLTSLNPALALNFQIRPSQVTNTGASVTLTDTTNNIASAFVSYMVCPSNANMPVMAQSSLPGLGGFGMGQSQNMGMNSYYPFLMD